MTARTLKFVRNPDVEIYEMLGWKRHDALDGTHHGAWSSLMEWLRHGEPDYPPPAGHEIPAPSMIDRPFGVPI